MNVPMITEVALKSVPINQDHSSANAKLDMYLLVTKVLAQVMRFED